MCVTLPAVGRRIMTAIVCDDHPLVRSALALVMTDLTGADVATAADFAQAWTIAEDSDHVSICIVDLHMPGMAPGEGLAGLKERAPDAKIVVVTGSDSDEELVEALDLGV